MPLKDAKEVFAWAAETLGHRIKRIPDGETGEQREGWQAYLPWFEENSTIERGPDVVYGDVTVKKYQAKAGVTPAFERPFQWAQWARESYDILRKERDRGTLAADAKLLVTLPHSIDAVASTATTESFDAIYDAYAAQMRASIQEIADAVPNQDLAIQWDVPTAGCVWAGYDLGDQYFTDRDFILREHIDHGEWVPAGVDLGFHLCFGDGSNPVDVGETLPDEELPADATGVTELCNDLVAGITRHVDFLHLPTYGHWLEPDHYAPLQGLAVGDTELSIGVINFRRDAGLENGIEHTRSRTASAREVIGDTFGISSSCGLGRYTPEQFAATGELFRELDRP
jgi:hypothetical protein